MKKPGKFIRLISFILSMAMLANCTVYKTVQKPPIDMDANYDIMLYKDELKFRLLETSMRSDTLFGKLSYEINEPGKRTKMIVCLKPGIQPAQDSTGLLMIPFSSIDYVEYYEVDHIKSNRQTIIAALLGVAGVIVIFSVIVVEGLKDLHMEFKVNQL